MNRPLVSIVITSFNYDRYVEEAIASALAQTYPAIEVIVVDDGSTDDSASVIDRVASSDRRVRVIHQANAGPVAAVLSGVRVCGGTIVCLLDADDRFHPTKVERVVEAFERDAALVQVAHGRRILGRDGGTRPGRRTNLSKGDVTGLLFRWGRYEWAVTSCLAYRRDVLLEILECSLDHPARIVDLHTTAAAPFFGPVGTIRDVLTDYRVHGANMHQDAARLLEWREATIGVINAWAARTGRIERIDAADDNELVLLRQRSEHPPTRCQRARACGRSLIEGLDLRRPPVDFALTMVTRTVLATRFAAGEQMLLMGPARYVRTKLRRP